MNWFLNLSTRAKLFLGFGSMLCFLVIVIVLAYYNLNELNVSQKLLYDRDMMIVENLLELRADQNRARGLMLEMIMTTNRSEQEKLKNQILERKSSIDSDFNLITKYTQDEPQFSAKFTELKSTINDYRQTREQQFVLISEGKINEAKQLSAGIQTDRFEKIRTTAIELSEMAKQSAKSDIEDNEQTVASTIRAFIILGIVATLLGGYNYFFHEQNNFKTSPKSFAIC